MHKEVVTKKMVFFRTRSILTLKLGIKGGETV
jgi:hypothetical protein